MSIADPAIAHIGINAAAMIASVLPPVSRRRRARKVPVAAALLRIVGFRIRSGVDL
ncbi:hypothetical protein NHF48_005455 [Sphingomonas sp. H160509]|uniref:hypothetical protein n=1 Tax=Sphingomonas sp. H160509 TaxID=2955313 RepID=UPI0021E92CA1|nr:hypothetical protein [Sphingomonas sp. H160509]MDD1450557.1 hypothetical protein [Sphingomonas sp. H160509]